jgi:hypothetical protein
MKKKIVVLVIIIVLLCSIGHLVVLVNVEDFFNKNMQLDTVEKNETILYVTQSCSMGYYWEYECEPDNYIELVEDGDVPKSIINMLAPDSTKYWKFKSAKHGEFSIYFLKYQIGEWLLFDESYVEDYYVDENLKIHLVGNKRPIYEIEKYDRKLISQFSKGFSQRIEWALDDYPEVRFSISNDYDSQSVNVCVYNNIISDENKIKQIIQDSLNKAFVELGEIMDGYVINITFEQSDINSNSDNDNISSED